MNINDLPEPIPATMRRHLEASLMEALRGEAANARNCVAIGMKTRQVSAATLYDFARGLSQAAKTIGFGAELEGEIVRQILRIDPNFEAHMRDRWQARPLTFVSTGSVVDRQSPPAQDCSDELRRLFCDGSARGRQGA